MNTKSSIVTSAADCCGNPSSIRSMDHLPSRDHKGAEYKESFMLSNRSSISRGSSIIIAVLTAAMLTGLASTALATDIYSDSFPGSSSSPLNGTSPATDSTGAIWNAFLWNADGSINIPNNSGSCNAYLPFMPTSGNIYTLTLGINATSGSGWIGLSFLSSGTGLTGGGGVALYQNAEPWTADWVSGNPNAAISTSTGPGTNGVNNWDYPYQGTGVQNLQMVLDTSGMNWTVQFSDNGTNLGSLYTYTTNPVIGDVGFGASAASGQVSNFSLTSSPVPEPTSVGLFALGCLGMMFISRKWATDRSA